MKVVQQQKFDLGGSHGEYVLVIKINRPNAANSFNGQMMTELTEAFDAVREDVNCRVVVLTGKGKHFSAGADLNWMKEAGELSFEENCNEAKKLQNMFKALDAIQVPTIAMVRGAAYGGAVGLIATCDYAFAADDARFCLSEVKVGLIPAVILPYLKRKIPESTLRRWAFTGKVIDCEEALGHGLIEKHVRGKELSAELIKEINQLMLASPAAQRALKRLFHRCDHHDFGSAGDLDGLTVDAIAKVRETDEARLGLRSFFANSEVPWKAKIEDRVQSLFE